MRLYNLTKPQKQNSWKYFAIFPYINIVWNDKNKQVWIGWFAYCWQIVVKKSAIEPNKHTPTPSQQAKTKAD